MKCKTCGKSEIEHAQLLRLLVDEFEDKASHKVRIACDKIPTSTLTSKVFDELWAKARAEAYYDIVRSNTINECTKSMFIDRMKEYIDYALP